jgi:hypothetical protein
VWGLGWGELILLLEGMIEVLGAGPVWANIHSSDEMYGLILFLVLLPNSQNFSTGWLPLLYQCGVSALVLVVPPP